MSSTRQHTPSLHPADTQPSVILAADGLCKTYSSGNQRHHAVRNVNLDIREGEFTVIMGNSGSGKSSLLYLLSGLEGATAGQVRYKGRDLHSLSEKELAKFRAKEMGYIYQSINLVPDLTLLENVALPGYVAGRPKPAVKSEAAALLEQMGLAGELGRLPMQTSGGQQQRAAIARALINKPRLLFADEPTGSLNYDHGVSVLNLLTELNQKGQSIVMVTHDIKAACRGDRIIVISDGKAVGDISLGRYKPEAMREREKIVFAFVTEEGGRS